MQSKKEELKNITTFRLGGEADLYIAETREDVESFFREFSHGYIIGGGSNVLVSDKPFTTPFLKIKFSEIKIISEDDKSVDVEVGAGQEWDDFVAWSVSHNYSGIELLSAIPGLVGGTPIQNVGAYGCEVKDIIISVKAYDYIDSVWKDFTNEECDFSYRKSAFQKEKRYCVMSVIFKLSKLPPKKPSYPSLIEYMERHQAGGDLLSIRNSVIEVRKNRLPDPKVIASVGSFFKNAYVDEATAKRLKEKYPSMPQYIEGVKVKLPSGWLIENSCQDLFEVGNLSLYKNNKLVVVNAGGSTLQEVIIYSDRIMERVREIFGVELAREPVVLEN